MRFDATAQAMVIALAWVPAAALADPQALNSNVPVQIEDANPVPTAP